MNSRIFSPLSLSTLCLAFATSLTACSKPDDAPTKRGATSGITVTLRVLETTDLHANIMDYNYYTGSTDATLGLARTASLIAAARDRKSVV